MNDDIPRRVMVILDNGRWVTIRELATTLRTTRREIEAAVEELRLEGQPIIAGAWGVCLTRDPKRLEAYIAARRERLVTIYRGTRSLRRTARQMRAKDDLTFWGAA